LIRINEDSLILESIVQHVDMDRGTTMYRILTFLILVITVGSWSSCEAAGSFQTRPAFSNVVTALFSTAPIAVPVTHAIAAPNLGCGRGRVRDSATHACLGPADIR
jgi:hypothetical protein